MLPQLCHGERKTGGRTSYLRRCKNLRLYGAVHKGARRSLRGSHGFVYIGSQEMFAVFYYCLSF